MATNGIAVIFRTGLRLRKSNMKLLYISVSRDSKDILYGRVYIKVINIWAMGPIQDLLSKSPCLYIRSRIKINDAFLGKQPKVMISFAYIGADYVGAWGLEPPLETATGGLSPL